MTAAGLLRTLRIFSGAGAVFLVLSGFASLCGWMLRSQSFTSWRIATVRIAPNAAFCFVLLGVCLFLIHDRRYRTAFPWMRGACRAGALVFGAVALLSLAEFFWQLDLGIDHLLLRPPAAFVNVTPRPFLMSPVAAFNFILLAAALLIIDRRTVREDWPAQYLAAGTSIGAVFGLCSLVLEPTISGVTMALPTAINFLVAAIALVSARADWAMGGLLTRGGHGSQLLRRTIPPVGLGLSLVVWALSEALVTRAHLPWAEASVLAIIAGTAIVGLVMWTALVVDRSDLQTERLERRVAERTEALAEAEARNRATFERAAMGIVHLSPEGRWLRVNDRFCEIVGYSREELLEMNYQQITYPQDLEACLAGAQQLLQGKIERATQLCRVIHKSGNLVWASFSVSVVHNPAHEASYMISTVEDITARKKAEAEAAELQEKLTQSQKMEAVGRLAGGIAHDFNNLLMVILAQNEALLMDLEGEQAERARSVSRAAERAAELTSQLLAFSRKQPIQPKVSSINQMVDGISGLLHRLVREDIDMRVSRDDHLWPVRIDRSQFEQVLMNLVVNARDAMPDGGRLTIETANAEISEGYAATHPVVPIGKYAMLAVTDTGVGMSEEVQARIFEPFFSTKETGKGTGLGLSMVYGIVKQNNGFIWVYSEPGKGSCFKIYLPCCEGEQSADEEQAETFLARERRTTTVLLVEDEDMLRSIICHNLETNGHKVIAAHSVEEANKMADAHAREIGLVLTDVVLRGGSVKQLVPLLQQAGCNCPIIYMSGYTPNAIVHQGVLDPGTLFLQKPFSLGKLMEKIDEALLSAGR